MRKIALKYRFEGGEFYGVIQALRHFGYYSPCKFFGNGWMHRREQGAIQQHERNQRIVDFVDATGLVPSKAWSSIFTQETQLFDWNHTLVWRQPFGGVIVTTEPHQSKTEKPVKDWEPPKGWRMAHVPNFGMWSPPDTKLLIMAPPKKGGDVAAVVQALSNLSLKS